MFQGLSYSLAFSSNLNNQVSTSELRRISFSFHFNSAPLPVSLVHLRTFRHPFRPSVSVCGQRRQLGPRPGPRDAELGGDVQRASHRRHVHGYLQIEAVHGQHRHDSHGVGLTQAEVCSLVRVVFFPLFSYSKFEARENETKERILITIKKEEIRKKK